MIKVGIYKQVNPIDTSIFFDTDDVRVESYDSARNGDGFGKGRF